MALILSIETATKVCSVAVVRDGKTLAVQELFLDKSHSGLLTVLIRDIIRYCGIDLKDLDAIAISEGPGSYTGLRIGTSTAKGLCFSLGIPLIAVNTLEAMVQGMMPYNHTNALLCPMIDARRMEVYCILAQANGEVIKPTHAKIIDADAFAPELAKQEIIFFGNGSEKCIGTIDAANAKFIEGVTTTAVYVGQLAEQKFVKEDFEDLAYFEPFYLKEFQVAKPKAV